jgi:hypothetical protein
MLKSSSLCLYSSNLGPPLLKIEISSNGQNCSILSQNVPKFELLKHNDELLNKYYGIFYELWTFADFDRLCILEKRGDEIFVLIEQMVSDKKIFMGISHRVLC